MSERRMIPADEAREVLAGIKSGPQRRAVGTEEIVDLLETVIAQAARIEQPDTELDAVASHSLAQGRKLRRQAAQIERVREVLAWAEQAESRAHADWIRTADTHHRDAALAYTQAVTWLRYALGDTDE